MEDSNPKKNSGCVCGRRSNEGICMTNIENLENEPVYVNPEHLNMLAIVLQVFVFPLVCYFWFTNNFNIFNNLAYIATIFTIGVFTANLYFGTLNYNNTYLDLFKKEKTDSWPLILSAR